MSVHEKTRGEILLDLIYDEVDQRLNPDGEGCPECGDEGYTYDCDDEISCVDPESGCEACARPCPFCAEHKLARMKGVREEVIKSGDVTIAVAWLKSVGRWHDGITENQIEADLAKAASTLPSAVSGGVDK